MHRTLVSPNPTQPNPTQPNPTPQRDALQQQLESKWAVIFQHYGRDLETVQATYEANKSKPPLPRNAPPIVS